MDAIQRRAEIHGARTERVGRATSHVTRKVGTTLQHLRRRGPARPFSLAADRLHARPFEARTTNADAVLHSLSTRKDEIHAAFGGRDQNRAGSIFARIGDDFARNSRSLRTTVFRNRILEHRLAGQYVNFVSLSRCCRGSERQPNTCGEGRGNHMAHGVSLLNLTGVRVSPRIRQQFCRFKAAFSLSRRVDQDRS